MVKTKASDGGGSSRLLINGTQAAGGAGNVVPIPNTSLVLLFHNVNALLFTLMVNESLRMEVLVQTNALSTYFACLYQVIYAA